MHSVYSDSADLTPAQVASAARAAGLDFITTTEHNTADADGAWYPHTGDDLLLILAVRPARRRDQRSPGAGASVRGPCIGATRTRLPVPAARRRCARRPPAPTASRAARAHRVGWPVRENGPLPGRQIAPVARCRLTSALVIARSRRAVSVTAAAVPTGFSASPCARGVQHVDAGDALGAQPARVGGMGPVAGGPDDRAPAGGVDGDVEDEVAADAAAAATDAAHLIPGTHPRRVSNCSWNPPIPRSRSTRWTSRIQWHSRPARSVRRMGAALPGAM